MTAITLHSATEAVRELLDQIDVETGELPAEYEQARALVATKAQAVTAYILETERQVESVKSYAKELLERAKTAERRAEWLRRYLLVHMEAAGIPEIRDERGIFSAKIKQNPPSVVIDEEGLIPEQFMRRKPPPPAEPDKASIKVALTEGREVPGAHLVRTSRVEIK